VCNERCVTYFRRLDRPYRGRYPIVRCRVDSSRFVEVVILFAIVRTRLELSSHGLTAQASLGETGASGRDIMIARVGHGDGDRNGDGDERDIGLCKGKQRPVESVVKWMRCLSG
jgi:hypothetical protein